jgi:sec-independent protein translocase protein TatB
VFNIGGGEVAVILLLALIVLGPQRLPEAARQIGKFMGELRRMSNGFQQELRSAMDDPLEAAARERGAAIKPASPDAPALAPVPPSTPVNGNGAAPPKKAAAKKAAPRKRAAPLRAAAKPRDPSAP